MRATTFLLLVMLLTCCKSSAQVGDEGLRKAYRESLEQLLKGDTLNDLKIIEFSIPTSREEAEIYYSYDYSKTLSKSFQNLQYKTFKLGVEGNSDVLTKYLYLSQFVDGYFAETYFDNIEEIAKAQNDLLCRILSKADRNKVSRLNEITIIYCP